MKAKQKGLNIENKFTWYHKNTIKFPARLVMEQEVKNQHCSKGGLMNACGVHALQVRKPETSHKPPQWNKAVLPLHPHRRAGIIYHIKAINLFTGKLFHLPRSSFSSLVVSR
jgi:hypothetical protein